MALKHPYGRILLHTTALIAVMCFHTQNATADPVGGTVTSGSAGITQSGPTTTILQSSDRAIIRWDSFDIHSTEHVDFVQPNSSSITVNRIRDSKPSSIDGKITANGNVVLINPNGLLFGSSSTIDVGGLVATSSDIEDDNEFMNGGAIKFTKPGNTDSAIINNGTITVREGGLVGLVAPHVENNGVIEATLGKVQLASGNIHTIDFAGDGLIQLEITDDVYSQSVKNTGTISADGGQILMTTAVARNVVNTLISNTGTLKADTVTLPDSTIKTGSIALSTHGLNLQLPSNTPQFKASVPTKIENTGIIQANGNLIDQMAGKITILADNILIGDGSVVSAVGDSGGGDIRIGGDYQGGNRVPTSDNLFISQYAILNANSKRRGQGGRIILWSDNNTRFYGRAEAAGGEFEGDGGFIEISGKKFLDFDGSINLLSPQGKNGTLFLDPTDIVISTGANSNVNGSTPFAPTADDVTSILNVTTLQTALAAGNVIVQTRATGSQPGNISVDDTITWSSGNTLTLDAHNAITVNAAISAGTGSVTMIAGGDVTFNADISGTGTLTIRPATNTTTMGVAGGAGTLNLSTSDLSRIIDGWGSIVLGRATSTVATTIGTRTWSDNLTLLSGTGPVNITGIQTIAANTLTITTINGAVSIGGVTGTTGGVTVNSGGGNISVGTALSTGGTVNLTSNGGTISNTANLSSGTLTLSSSGGAITIGSSITASGAANILSGAGAININAALNSGANALTITTTGANISSNASGAITGGIVNITSAGGDIVTASTITSSNTTAINSGTGLLTLGGTLNTGTAAASLTTTARAISTNAISSGALTLSSGGGTITTNGVVAANGTTNVTSGGAAVNLNAAFGSGTGALTITTGGGTLTKLTGALSSSAFTITTSNGNVSIGGGITATGNGSINSGTGSVSITGTTNTGTGTLGITTTGNTITTGNITSGALTLASSGGNISTGAITTTGTTSINAGAATINIGNTNAAANSLTLTSNGFGITTGSITSGALTIGSSGGVITTNGAVAASGTTGITSGGGAVNINNALGAGALTITTSGGAFTKANTGAITSAALNITTSNGNISIGTGGVTTTAAATLNSGTGSTTIGGTFSSGANTLNITTSNNTISIGAGTSGALNLLSGGGAITTTGARTATGVVTITTSGGNANINGSISSTTSAQNITTAGGAITNTAAITATTGAITLNSGGGNITVGTGGINTSTGAVSLNSGAAGLITVNNVINITGNGNLTITTDTNLALNIANALSGTGGTFALRQFSAGTSIGVGSGQTGDILIDATEFARIRNGWGNIDFGRNDGTAQINIAALTWNDSLTLRSASGGINTNGVQNFGGNNFTVITDSNYNLMGDLIGTGTLTIAPQTVSTTIGIGTGQAGMIAFTDAEVGFLDGTWGNIIIGSTTMTGNINVGALTWADPLNLRTNTGIININGVQTLGGNAINIQTNSDLNLGANIAGTGAVTISTVGGSATTMGIGDGQTGTLHLSNAELARITSGKSSITFGSTTANGAINVGARSWSDALNLQSGNGIISINGAQTMAANRNLNINTNANLVIGANLIGSGTGVLTITNSAGGTSIGIGDGQAGTLHLSNAELDFIQNGWSSRIFGSTAVSGAMNVGAYTWQDNVEFRTSTGLLTIAGAQNTGSNNLSILTNSALNINAALSGTGNLTIRASDNNTTMAIGNGQTGTIQLGTADLANIQNSWNTITFGHTGLTAGTINVGAVTWNTNIAFASNTASININGAQDVGNHNLTFTTNGNPNIAAGLSGTGNVLFQSTTNNVDFGIGTGQSGAVSLSNTDLGNILNGWNSITFANTGTGADINIGEYTWQYDTIFRTNAGVITVAGNQTTSRNLTFESNSDIAINANLIGTGTLNFQQFSTAGSIGLAGAAGGLNINSAELGRIVDGWSLINFGRTDATSTFQINAHTWNDNARFLTGTGIITIAGQQNAQANDLTYIANSNIAINADLVGTGNLAFQGSLITTSIGVSSGTGTLAISSAEFLRILDGWNSLTFGDISSTAIMQLGTNVWKDNVTVITRGNVSLTGIQSSDPGVNMTFVTLAGSFINSTGSATPIAPGAGGRYLVYSVSPGTDSVGPMILPTQIFTQSFFGHTPDPTGNFIIYSSGAPRILFLKIDDKSKIYGDAVPNLTFTYLGGLQGADTLSAAIPSFSLTAAGASVTDSVGTLTPITGTFSTALGYSTVVTDGVLSVTKAPILVSPSNTSQAYGDAYPGTTLNYIGLRNGETSAVIDTLATSTAGTDNTTNVGTYTITASGAIDNNYTFNYTTGILTINPAVLTITTQNVSREYGLANPALSIVYSGFKNNEDESVLDIAPTISTTALITSNVGGYAITSTGAADTNYSFNYVDTGILNVTPAILTGTISNATREYGLANPSFNINYSGFRNLETSAIISTNATLSTTAGLTSNVGNYAITGSGAVAPNYTFNYVNGTLDITKALLTATSQNATREYGLANPAFTFNYTGFRNGETSTVIDTLAVGSSAGITADVGSYAITGSGAIDNNYNFIYVDTGNLSITKALLTATSQNATREYGLANPALSLVYTGFRNGDDNADIDTLGTAATVAGLTSNVGSYAITGSGAIDNNYDFTYVNTGNLSVTKATLTVQIDDKTKVEGTANPIFTATYSGFRNSENLVVIDTLPVFATSATLASPAGNYAITGSGGLDNNYSFNYTAGNLLITSNGITPPTPDPIPTPAIIPNIPSTAEDSISPKDIFSFIYANNLFDITELQYEQKLRIIYVDDDFLISENSEDEFLIAITKELRKGFYQPPENYNY